MLFVTNSRACLQGTDREVRESRVARATNRRTAVRSQLFMMVRSKDDAAPLWAVDLSMGGMQCRAKKARFPGTYLDVQFTLPTTRESIKAGAQVVSLDLADDGTMLLGLRFCALSTAAQASICQFLEARKQMWQAPSTPRKSSHSPNLRALEALQQPFADLLEDAYAQLKETPIALMQPTSSRRTETPTKILRVASGVLRSLSGIFQKAA